MAEIKALAPQGLTERIGVITTTGHGQTRPFARSTTTAYFQPQLATGPGGRIALLAFVLPVRTAQASVMLSMKQSNPADSGFGAITA